MLISYKRKVTSIRKAKEASNIKAEEEGKDQGQGKSEDQSNGNGNGESEGEGEGIFFRVLSLLVDYGAEVEVKDKDNKSFRQYALDVGIFYGPTSRRLFRINYTPDICANARIGSLVVLHTLLTYFPGFINPKYEYARKDHGFIPFTPLSCAVENGQVEMVNYLLERGADVNAVDSTGYTALTYAIKSESYQIVQCLLTAGANIRYETPSVMSPLNVATQCQLWGLVEVLLRKHATGVVDPKVSTPLKKTKNFITSFHKQIGVGCPSDETLISNGMSRTYFATVLIARKYDPLFNRRPDMSKRKVKLIVVTGLFSDGSASIKVIKAQIAKLKDVRQILQFKLPQSTRVGVHVEKVSSILDLLLLNRYYSTFIVFN